MKDFDTIKKVQMFMSDMNVFNGRTNGDVKGLFAKFLDFYVARINKYVGVSNE